MTCRVLNGDLLLHFVITTIRHKGMRSCAVQGLLLPASGIGAEDMSDRRDSSLLKVCKCEMKSSKCSSLTADKPLQQEQVPATSPIHDYNAEWPSITGCDSIRKALTFLESSRQHALILMMQNRWERAVTVFEKIEKAAENVSFQRRQGVIQQANAGCKLLIQEVQELDIASRRIVRFSDHVTVNVCDDMDRTCDEFSEPMRDEMLVLRASRKIPHENLSEFWIV